MFLKYIAAEVGVFGDPAELSLDEGGVDDERVAPALLGLETDVLEQLLHHRLEPARADILDRFVDLGGDAGERLDAVLGEGDGDALGVEKRLILLGQAGAGGREDADEILLGQRLELDSDRKPALKLGKQVGGLGDVERAGSDEQDMVGLQRAVFGRDRRALDQRQKVALDALAADRAAADVADRDLVDLVEEDDAVRLSVGECDAVDVVGIEPLVGFLLGQARRKPRAP